MRGLLVLGLTCMFGCGGVAAAKKSAPPTKMEEIVGSWLGSDLSLTIKEDGSCSSRFTIKQGNGVMTDLLENPKLKQEGEGYSVPIPRNQTESDTYFIDVSDDGKTMTLTQTDGPKTLQLAKSE